MNSQERAPSISIDLETDWIVNDIGTSPLYCLTDPIHLVDPTQDSQHTIAGAGDCFRHDIAFRYSADIHPGE